MACQRAARHDVLAGRVLLGVLLNALVHRAALSLPHGALMPVLRLPHPLLDVAHLLPPLRLLLLP